ncbi:MAG: hypothetical protein IJP92_10570 [Lachnospiraceae bacterium]|nr:hypothetical protein [Lachnospiraceae bacterium]
MKKSRRRKTGNAAENRSLQASYTAVSVLTILCAGAGAGFSLWYRGEGNEALVRGVITALVTGTGTAFALLSARMTRTLFADNGLHPWRFFAAYAGSLAVSLLLPLVRPYLWPVPFFFVLLQLTSETVTGLFAGTGMLLLSVLFCGEETAGLFFMLFAASSCTMLLYRHTDAGTRFVWPAVSQALLHLLAWILYALLFAHEEASVSAFLLPALCAALTALVTAVFARTFLLGQLRRNTERYLDINDPEFSLLQAIRTKQKAVYDLAIHTAYLTERCAEALQYRTQAAKTVALYHRIGCLDDTESEWPDVAHYYVDFEFPQEALTLLREYIRQGREHPESREATLVYLCDSLVQRITALFANAKDATADYDTMIDTLFAECEKNGIFSASAMTLAELHRTAELLKQEKLYYDFLR